MRVVLACFLLLGAASAQTSDELNFTSAIGELREISRALPQYFIADARTHLATRPRIASMDALKARQDQVRRQMIRNIGGFPERTPLNAKVVGVVEREHYRIEKIIFESQPQIVRHGEPLRAEERKAAVSRRAVSARSREWRESA